MAFFSGLSSSIGKKLLLYGLRQIDILDKDPTDFVSVDVGKRTTLEVRDVGLHVKKLVALLHLKLPPEIQLTRARASLLRVTFVLDFGVPQISIEVDGIQVVANLVDNEDHAGRTVPSPPASPKQRRSTSSPRARDNWDGTTSDDEEHVPTVDELARSFLRAEHTEDIRELEQELESRSEYLQESATSSDDGDDASTGMGAPLALPTYLRNILNTAIDRLSLVINNVDIEVEDHLPKDSSDEHRPDLGSHASLNFHIERIAIDSLTSQTSNVEVEAMPVPPIARPELSRRRMHIENVCARLVSDAVNFASMSRLSQVSSPAANQSGVMNISEPAYSQSLETVDPTRSTGGLVPEVEPGSLLEPDTPVEPVPCQNKDLEGEQDQGDESIGPSASTASIAESSIVSLQQDASAPMGTSSPEYLPLASSMHTVDDDRFADACSDEEMPEDSTTNLLSHSLQSPQSPPPSALDGSSILYDDDGMLEYALQNDLFNSRFDDALNEESDSHPTGSINQNKTIYGQQSQVSLAASEESTSNLPTVSALGRSFPQSSLHNSQIQSRHSESREDSTDNLVAAQHLAIDPDQTMPSSEHESLVQSPQSEKDLTESQLFTHDDAESMYMSAVSATPIESSHRSHIPGGWDSSSTSSKSTASFKSSPIPEAMISGSILVPVPETEDGFETPRPGTPQSRTSSPQLARAEALETNPDFIPQQAKVLLTINWIVVWIPFAFDEHGASDDMAESTASSIAFGPGHLGEDSIFAEMPGSFSNYAHSSTRRQKPTMESSVKRRQAPNTLHFEHPAERPKQKPKTPPISIEVGTVAAHMDVSTGRIMYGMLIRVLNALNGETVTQEKGSETHAVAHDELKVLEVSVEHVGFAWLENIMPESHVEGQPPNCMLELRPPDAIVRLNIDAIHISNESRALESRMKLKISTFILASLNQDIISFHLPKARSRQSSTQAEQLKNDVEIEYSQSADDKRITVVTRPVEVVFDIQKLDEALGSFGGFSGMLELSSSISSANNIHSPVLSPIQPRPRGVRFGDTPTPLPKAVTAASQSPKLQVQLGEVSFTLKGRSCAVQLQTTTVRIAVRESNVRLKVSEVVLSGPYVDATQTGAPLLVEIRGTTINFLFAPEETDLARLISMITPSKDPYENNDDILIDTLLRQRRKGSVLRLEVTSVAVRLSDLEEMKSFEALGAEIVRLSKVTKYLPDDDRPGLLTLATIQQFTAGVAINDMLGDVSCSLQNVALAHVGVPALLATEIGKATVSRGDEILMHEVIKLRPQDQLPAIMVRMVGDEMEPVIKAKFFNVCVEYHVSTIMAALGISEDGTVDDIALGIAASVATITGASSPKTLSRQSTQGSSPQTVAAKPLQIDLLTRNCAIGLNPRKLSSKGLFVLTEAHIAGKQAKSEYSITVEFRKASIHAIDNVARLDEDHDRTPSTTIIVPNRHLQELRELGFVSLSSISAAKIFVNITGDGKDSPQLVDVEFKNELFVLESCADSTQTLIAILNGLQPPTPPSTAERYRTVVPLQEMMESFTGDALETTDGDDDFMSNADLVEDEVPTNLEFVGSIYNSQSLPTNEEMGDSLLGEDDLGALATPPLTRQRGDRGLLESFQEKYEVTDGEQGFDFNENYFRESDTEEKGKARKWNSTRNQYHLSNEFKVPDAPLKVRIRDMNIIWNLFDGYDWPRTRGIISQAVDNVEARAEERRRKAYEEDEDDDFVEEDFLFNSVWIGVPVKDEKGGLARRINHDIDDLASETGSYATSTATRSTGATARPRSSTSSKRRLKLERSKHKKIAFSLMGVAVDLIVFPPDSGETINSIDVRVRDFEIFDHVPTSTWKKFVTCLIEPSARQMNKPMINLDLLTVKPVTDLAASELVVKVTVLPLRLHVDQDALDFITRFFEFKDETDSDVGPASNSEQPFIQRMEIKAVTLKLDYKPKRVDYRGLRSGHTTEFMNFLILDGSDIVLRHAIVYGITSFDKLHKTLNDVWMPDVQRNQLPGVLSGLAAVRPLVNVGSGMRDLVVVPMREYKKDGRVVRSLQKGVYAFAKNTTSEVARLGAKVAIGTQTLLEGAEAFLVPTTGSPSRGPHSDWDGEDPTSSPPEEARAVSHYANQPIGVRAGLRSAARYLERDLLTARDAVIAIPAEVMEEGSGVGMARALARHAPTVILRPALGATKALSNALLGVGNALDEGSRRKIDDKYKSY